MTTITGVTFPIPKPYMTRFFDEGRTVFVKPATVFKELKAGMKFVFYQSHEDTGYVGEARIKQVLLADDLLTFFETFGDAVFLAREEVRAYVENQERWQGVRVRKGEGKKKTWMALELEGVRRYTDIQKPTRFVPVGGKYLRE
ncbi:DUF365 domain-containing protein [Methanofollis ethanolicus]|uniref:DUF365 domain-containing protein n=1 Tax=Methanofollis ethanolicus TaxID=488124 RepID=UPI00082E3522|nr:DUF365 domain-containing protein [Methanofollis ethanolicus]